MKIHIQWESDRGKERTGEMKARKHTLSSHTHIQIGWVLKGKNFLRKMRIILGFFSSFSSFGLLLILLRSPPAEFKCHIHRRRCAIVSRSVERWQAENVNSNGIAKKKLRTYEIDRDRRQTATEPASASQNRKSPPNNKAPHRNVTIF